MRGVVCALVVSVVALPGCGGGGKGSASTRSDAAAKQAQQQAADDAAHAEAERAAKAERKKARERRFKRYLKVALLPQAGKSRKEQLRISEAVDKLAQLAKEDVSAVAPLLTALKKKDYGRIRKLHPFYIRLGKPHSESTLLDALYGGPADETTVAALAYLASNNQKLITGTKKWAASKGYTITGTPTTGLGRSWGCLGIYRHRAANAPPTGLEC
jgi:hypothetical protein